ncbi:MAG: 7TM diverse intracellular signaling domain-containing protein [Bacteroidales bacterium]
MKIRLFLFLSISLVLSSLVANSAINKPIKEGLLDLSVIDIEKSKNIKLQGECEFYWKQLLEPKDFISEKEAVIPTYVKIPKSWTTYTIKNTKLSNKGYATYRIIIKKIPDSKKKIYGLKISSVFTNYKLWVNGELLTEVGAVSNIESNSKPKFKYQDIPFVLDPDKGPTEKVEIIMQVSNYSHQRAGLQKPIYFGTFDNLRASSRWMDILNLIIIGIILVIGINHLNMYLFRRNDISNLYFSIVCIVMILRNISTEDRIITYIFPNINWELLVKLDNFSGFGTIPLFALFFYSLFKDDFPKIMKNALIAFGIFVTLLVFITPANFYGKFRTLFEIYILIGGLYVTFGVLLLAALRKRETALFTFIGMFILYATAINDVLSSMGIIQTAYVAPYGLVTFMVIQSITITYKSAKAINQNEHLSNQLTHEKENLEKNIFERTKELQSQHDLLILHQKKEQQQSWINNGIAQINNILADNKNDFTALSDKVLSKLVKYVGANFGVLYMLNQFENTEPYLELISDYGCSNETREQKAKIHTNTGMIGAAFTENRVMVINNIPENYIKIKSGLGESKPNSLIIVPLSIENNVFGMMEIASFKPLTELETEFIKRIALNIAAQLNNTRMNEKNLQLIEKYKEQEQIMSEKEEEIRQNFEELKLMREEYEKLTGTEMN